MAHATHTDQNVISGLGVSLSRRNSINSNRSNSSVFSIATIKSFIPWRGSGPKSKEFGKVVVFEPLDKKLSFEEYGIVNGKLVYLLRLKTQTET